MESSDSSVHGADQVNLGTCCGKSAIVEGRDAGNLMISSSDESSSSSGADPPPVVDSDPHDESGEVDDDAEMLGSSPELPLALAVTRYLRYQEHRAESQIKT